MERFLILTGIIIWFLSILCFIECVYLWFIKPYIKIKHVEKLDKPINDIPNYCPNHNCSLCKIKHEKNKEIDENDEDDNEGVPI